MLNVLYNSCLKINVLQLAIHNLLNVHKNFCHTSLKCDINHKGSKKCFHSCDGNSGFSHDLIFVEVLEWDDIVWFIIFSVCKRFGS